MNHCLFGMSLLLVAGVLGACGSSDGDGSEKACVPGRSVECTGPSGCLGVQVCTDDGSAYGPCACTADTADTADASASSSSPSGGSTEIGTSSGGSTSEDGSGGTSSSVSSAGEGTSSGGSSASSTTASGGSEEVPEECDPVSMSDWLAPAYVPARSPDSVCSQAQIQQFIDDCLLGQDCSAFEDGGDHAECGQCLWPSALEDSSMGPVIEIHPRPFYRWETNVAGCVELRGEAECAVKIQAAQACAREACLSSCGATSPGYSDCVGAARAGTCASYEQAAVCIMDAETAELCTGGDFSAIVLNLGKVFCGS